MEALTNKKMNIVSSFNLSSDDVATISLLYSPLIGSEATNLASHAIVASQWLNGFRDFSSACRCFSLARASSFAKAIARSCSISRIVFSEIGP